MGKPVYVGLVLVNSYFLEFDVFSRIQSVCSSFVLEIFLSNGQYSGNVGYPELHEKLQPLCRHPWSRIFCTKPSLSRFILHGETFFALSLFEYMDNSIDFRRPITSPFEMCDIAKLYHKLHPNDGSNVMESDIFSTSISFIVFILKAWCAGLFWVNPLNTLFTYILVQMRCALRLSSVRSQSWCCMISRKCFQIKFTFWVSSISKWFI